MTTCLISAEQDHGRHRVCLLVPLIQFARANVEQVHGGKNLGQQPPKQVILFKVQSPHQCGWGNGLRTVQACGGRLRVDSGQGHVSLVLEELNTLNPSTNSTSSQAPHPRPMTKPTSCPPCRGLFGAPRTVASGQPTVSDDQETLGWARNDRHWSEARRDHLKKKKGVLDTRQHLLKIFLTPVDTCHGSC